MKEMFAKIKIPSPAVTLKYFGGFFDRTDLKILITVLIAGIINNFYFFISQGLQADALSGAFFQIAGLWETQLGRPLIQIVDGLRYGFVNQLLVVLMCLIFIALAVMLLRRIFQIKNTLLLYLLAVLICVAPQFTEVYEFLYCADSYLLAFLLAIVAVYALTRIKAFKDSKKWYLCAVLATAATCGFYQAYLGCLIGLTILVALREALSSTSTKEVLQHFIRNACVILVGVCFYYLALFIYCGILGTSLASYKGADGLFSMDTILALPEAILNCFKDFAHFFLSSRIIFNKFYGRAIIYIILFITLALGLVCRLRELKSEKLAKVGLALFLLAIFPIGVNATDLLTATAGIRINLVTAQGIVVTSLLLAVIFGKTPQEFAKENLLHWVGAAATIALIVTFVISNTFTYVYRQQQYDHLKVVMQDVYGRVVTLPNYNSEMPWIFSNIIPVNSVDVERTNGVVTTNPVTWPSYAGAQRYALFLDKFMGIRVHTVDETVYRETTQTKDFQNMPVYPADGSVKIIDGKVVIKVSETVFE